MKKIEDLINWLQLRLIFFWSWRNRLSQFTSIGDIFGENGYKFYSLKSHRNAYHRDLYVFSNISKYIL